MLSITESKKILNKNGLKYTDEEINKIRDFIYMLAEIDYEIFTAHLQKEKDVENQKLKSNTINPNQNENNTEKVSDTIHKS